MATRLRRHGAFLDKPNSKYRKRMTWWTTFFFLNLVPSSEETSFWPPSMVSHHHTYYTLQILLDLPCGQLYMCCTIDTSFLWDMGTPNVAIFVFGGLKVSFISPQLYHQATMAGSWWTALLRCWWTVEWPRPAQELNWIREKKRYDGN